MKGEHMQNKKSIWSTLLLVATLLMLASAVISIVTTIVTLPEIMEAAKEIAKQIRLRDIGGIIIVDFIDMHEEEHRKKIIEIVKEKVASDRSKIQVEEFTKLNLLELTRKHICSNYK